MNLKKEYKINRTSEYLEYTRGVLKPRTSPLTTELIKIEKIIYTLEINGINKGNLHNKYKFKRLLEIYRIKIKY